MATFGAATFYEIVDEKYGQWQWHKNIVEKPVVNGTWAYTFLTGEGNRTLKLRAKLTEAEYNNLLAAYDMVERTLTVYGVGYANVLLREMGEPEVVEGLAGWWELDLTFTRRA